MLPDYIRNILVLNVFIHTFEKKRKLKIMNIEKGKHIHIACYPLLLSAFYFFE